MLWNEYFMMLARMTASRSTCLAPSVGAVIVKNKQVLAMGYNGAPSGSRHCTDQGFCYESLSSCSASKTLLSRAVHAEASAIGQAAQHGISTLGSSIYVTLEPYISCLKLVIAAGIRQIYYETSLITDENAELRDSFVVEGLINLQQVVLPPLSVQKLSALYPIFPDSSFELLVNPQ
ncbi:dCMP deaminase family protein [Microcoleus sp. F10-C6]|uniref:dCMP deaminase family protein n=1 Tax=unclassified Microcoleus TaxID=2642155 RepID=UPI002FD08AFF